MRTWPMRWAVPLPSMSSPSSVAPLAAAAADLRQTALLCVPVSPQCASALSLTPHCLTSMMYDPIAQARLHSDPAQHACCTMSVAPSPFLLCKTVTVSAQQNCNSFAVSRLSRLVVTPLSPPRLFREVVTGEERVAVVRFTFSSLTSTMHNEIL
jgi:hypothetical protein